MNQKQELSSFLYTAGWVFELSVFIAFYIVIFLLVSAILYVYFTHEIFYRVLSIALMTALFSNLISKVLIGYLKDY